MKSLAQSEGMDCNLISYFYFLEQFNAIHSTVSCWTDYEVENEKDGEDQKSLDGSERGSNVDQSDPPKDDAQSQKSDSAYGSRGSIQSPNRYRLKGWVNWILDFIITAHPSTGYRSCMSVRVTMLNPIIQPNGELPNTRIWAWLRARPSG